MRLWRLMILMEMMLEVVIGVLVMEVDKVANEVTDMEVDKVADMKIEIINKDMKLIIYSPDNWVHIYEERYMQYIRMQNKQMIICENISGSAGDPH